MSYFEWVKSLIPDATAEECHYVLWDRTPFPLVRQPENLKPYIDEYLKERKKDKG
jgi:hypothetical protein